ncbi:glycoside hydrolase family 3 N-terminal domain-containing protein [Gracilibacillus sp. YIM 98692]|uniref:glycoside hydrolase family 3 N-terminal domain-containing protein n=1 Tax=Gracilibacillus sp. YIM 98692 TaxID=2663532 RepID=UPI0013D4B4A5|nr:glycoside hydrolase family 3 N-terminal domain-containing protein [Gracilibacillus sp. YIM 98692]
MYKTCDSQMEKQINDLIKSMTLKEKVGQLNQKLYGWQVYKKTDDGYELTDTFKNHVDQFGGIGALYGLFRADPWSGINFENGIPLEDCFQVTNMIKQYLKEHTRLGIPALLSEECPHGHQALDSTVFPTHIGAGATWNPDLQQSASSHVASELMDKGVHLGLVSTLDIARDPRWGRTEECFSEDPYLASQMTKAVVHGMQGSVNDSPHVLPVLKHFAAQGAAVGGHNAGPALIGERELREIYLPPMKAGIEAGALACMAAYNEIDGIPCHVNRKLLTDILREEWNFKGIVMADGTALDRLLLLTGDEELAAAYALNAGVDLSLWDDIYTKIEAAVTNGKVDESLVDLAVKRVLYLKFRLGIMSGKPAGRANKPQYKRLESKQVNLEMARQSITLIKNNHHLLPLSKKQKRIAIIGPSADNVYNMLGDYTPPQRREAVVTIKDGIASIVEKDTEIFYTKGCGIRSKDTSDFKQAKTLAEKADVIILALGGSSAREFGMEFQNNGAVEHDAQAEMDCGENIDVANLKLGGVQERLVQELASFNIPMIGVLIQGRPYSLKNIESYLDAILIGWYPGQLGGQAIAEVIFGDVNPSGKLPISIPYSADQLPVYYNYKNSGAKQDYYDEVGHAIYRFGYGLSYTSFECSFSTEEIESINLKSLEKGERVKISVNILNKGSYDGYAVVQLYIQDMEASVTRRIKELKAFKKIWLEAGQSKQVNLELGFEELSVWNVQMEQVVEPGNVLLMVGESSNQLETKKLVIDGE